MQLRLSTTLLLLGSLGLASACLPQIITATLPNGRQITPEGLWIATAPYPFALAVRPDGGQLLLPSIGFPFALNVIDHPGTPTQSVRRLPLRKPDDPDIQVHAGVVYSPDSQWAYVATGDTGAVDIYSASTWQRSARIPLNGSSGTQRYEDSFAAALAIDATGQRLYVLDQGNWRVVVVDLPSRQILLSYPTGVDPIALALSPDGNRLYIVNAGLFEYQLLPKIDREDVPATGLRFAPFGYPSAAARNGVRVQGRKVPGLGKENSGRGSSLWTYQLAPAQTGPLQKNRKKSFDAPVVLRLGTKIVESPHGVVGGASPSAVVADRDQVFVTLAHQDSVALISPDGRRLQAEIPLQPFPLAKYHDAQGQPLRGIMPSGLALGPGRLYVTEAGINALAVIDTKTAKVVQQRPVGWNPSAVALSVDGKSLYVVNTKGKGTGPNAGSRFNSEASGSYIGELAFGSVSVLPVDGQDASTQVLRNNEAALTTAGRLPHVKHVFLIIRENRTFDEVFGDLKGAQGDPSLARYGLAGWTEEKPELKDLQVTPNAHALAEQFASSDNFYADSDVSCDGHRWLFGMATTPWMNMAWTSNYGGRRQNNAYSSAPGRRAMFGGSDSPMPEDEPQFGSLWEHIAAAKLPILNYGEGLEIEGSDERDGALPEGQRNLLNAPLPKPVFESSDRQFPTFNLGIPDQLRFAEFQHDFSKRLQGSRLPALIVIRLPNDHTTEIRPADGYPYRASYISDNDLALGKIVQFLSQSKIWQDSAVFVTEDDAQGGRDHIDAHRTLLLVASPWVKPGYLSHRHASFVSIQKTIYALLGLGPLNLEDALAPDLSDMFASAPKPKLFAARPSDLRVFDPARARTAKPKTQAERAALLECDNPRTIGQQFENEKRKLR